MLNIYFRCDASILIGTGHVMRCRELARSLRARGCSVNFICRNCEGDLISHLEGEFKVMVLPELSGSTDENTEKHYAPDEEGYGKWLGCSEGDDALDTCKALEAEESSVDWVIVDHYGLGERWEALVRENINARQYRKKVRIMAIDDLANRKHISDILLDQNFHGDNSEARYEGLVGVDCKKLLGPQYALLSDKYRVQTPKNREGAIKKLLIYFGGVDTYNCTAKAIKAVGAIGGTIEHIDVVIGLQCAERENLERLCHGCKNMSSHYNLDGLHSLLIGCDLAIGAGGFSNIERLCVGVPAIVVLLAENQVESSNALHREGFVHLIGHGADIVSTDIKVAVEKAIDGAISFADGRHLTHGLGTALVTNAVAGCSDELFFDPAKEGDEMLLLRWANEGAVRFSRLNNKLIGIDEHHQWFHSLLKDPMRRQWILRDIEGCPLGQLRIDLDAETGKGEIDYSVDHAVRGQGLGKRILLMAMDAAKSCWGSDLYLAGKVLRNNTPSNKSFEAAGFIEINSSSNLETREWELRAQ